MKKHFTYSNVVATLALVFAMTGGAYAAGLVPKNSVNSGSIRNGSITTKDVKDRSLRARDFAQNQLPAGPTGAAGSAKAYASVKADGTLDLTRSTTNVSLRNAEAGKYCVKVTGVEERVALVSLDSSDSKHSQGDNEWGLIDSAVPGGSNAPCNSDETLVRTFYVVTGGSPPDQTFQVTYDNSAFNVIFE